MQREDKKEMTHDLKGVLAWNFWKVKMSTSTTELHTSAIVQIIEGITEWNT